ncbi:MAG: inositol monophosphatase family protein [Spirochaetia bacterium]|nr:inositol monophosphatase family protein [Spirochaetia bacterium]
MNIKSIKNIVTAAASEELLPRFNKIEFSHKADGSVITEADFAMQNRIEKELRNLHPEISFLGEEMNEDEQKSIIDSGMPFWCLDPLDGTLNFSTGFPVFSVSLALIENRMPILGIVYDPVRDECFYAEQDKPAYLNDTPLEKKPSAPLARGVGMIDMKRLGEDLYLRFYRERPFSSQRSIGSVALEWCWLAAGRAHVYLHGRQNLWDYAAGYLIFRQAGGYACTLEGKEFFSGELKASSAVGACTKELFLEWKEWLKID